MDTKGLYVEKDPSHAWCDGWDHWSELVIAIEEMGKCAKKARILVHDKEKWGSYVCDLGGMWDGTLRWALGKYFPDTKEHWYDKVDEWFSRIWNKVGLVDAVHKLQKKVYNREVQKVFDRHPEIVHELVVDNLLYDFIEPTKEGYVDGKKIHDLYWKKL